MTAKEVKNYKQLLEFIEQSMPGMNVMDIPAKMGISWGTYNTIKRNQRVRTTTVRKVFAFVETLGYQVNGTNGKIQLEPLDAPKKPKEEIDLQRTKDESDALLRRLIKRNLELEEEIKALRSEKS